MTFLAAFEKHLKDFESGLFFSIFLKQAIFWTLFVFVAMILLRVAKFPLINYGTTVLGVALIALTFSIIYSLELYVAEKYENIKKHDILVHKKKGYEKPLLHIQIHKVRKAHKPKVKSKTFKLKIKRDKKKSIFAGRIKPVSKEFFKK